MYGNIYKLYLMHDVNSLISYLLGIRGIYQGLVPTILKQSSNQAIRFCTIETLKDWYRGGDKDVVIPKVVTGIFGAIAGACSVFGNTPIDVVKTRMQVNISFL